MEQTESQVHEQVDGSNDAIAQIVVYVAPHCPNCEYARRVAEVIRRDYPYVAIRVVDIESPQEPIPDVVFATPTYLLNGRVWSLGNPSPQQIHQTLTQDLGLG